MGINLKCSYSDSFIGRHWRIDIDKRKISQVIRNLLSNAIKFTKNHGNEINVFVDIVETISTPTMLKIDVIDQGVGISKVNIYSYLKYHFKYIYNSIISLHI